MRLYTRIFLPLLAVLLTAIAVSAQDVHFSQFGNAPMNLNPGLAGVFGGDLRFVGNYRTQWRGVPVPYSTVSGAVENKFYHKPGKYDRYFTGGLMINYDRQGSLSLTSLQLAVPITYTAPLAKGKYLTFGLMPTFGQRSFGTNNISFDEQFVDSYYDPKNAISENINSNNIKYFDLSGGLNLRMQAAEKRNRLDLGVGMHHLNRPRHDFWVDDNVRLNTRMTFYGVGLLQVTNKVDALGQIIYQRQGAYQEVVYGISGRLFLNQKPYNELAVQFGVNYRHRFNDAIIPHAELHWRTWTLGLTYDLNLSDFNVATARRGGPEIALIYRLYRLKPMPFKSCPII